MSDSVLNECGHPFDTSGWFMNIPKSKRAAARAKKKAEREKNLRVQAIRANWTQEELDAEEERLREEIEQIIKERDNDNEL